MAIMWTLGRRDPKSSLSVKTTFALVFVALSGAVPAAVLGTVSVAHVDNAAAEREADLLRRGMAESIETITREQQVITIWNEAVVHARDRDLQWLDDNVGIWLTRMSGHDQVYMLDARDAPFYVARDGRREAPKIFSAEYRAIRPLVAQVRAQLAEGVEPQKVAAVDLLSVEGQISVVSVVPFAPYDDRVAFIPHEAELHVSVRHLDSAFAKGLSDDLLVEYLHIGQHALTSDLFRSMPLFARDGAVAGHLSWQPYEPARVVMWRMVPSLILTGLVILSIVGGLLLRLRAAADEVQRQRCEAEHLAFHDALTDLPNRAYFGKCLREALLVLKRRDDAHLAVHYVDLDRFKNVNDTLGHPAGDELIRQVAARLATVLRAEDIVARLGGDEFAILQPGIKSSDEAVATAQRALEAVQRPFDLFGNEVFIDASIGVVLAPEAGLEEAELVRKADIALYEAKATGKGRMCVFTADLDAAVVAKRAIERDLREALSLMDGPARELYLAYQPIYAIDGKTLIGAEALMRWTHPKTGFVPPSQFIPVAEERGLMPRLGAWALREACALARDVGLPFVAVNVSPVQFREPGFVDDVLAILAEARLSAERLQIEITESLLLDGNEDTRMAVTRLRYAGVSIALDDFGTGYSSLRYLHQFQVDKIKIDRSFIEKLGTGERADGVVRAIIDLAQTLRLETTAEGVETAEQWQRLAAFGAPQLQGYFFSRPLAREALEALMAAEEKRLAS